MCRGCNEACICTPVDACQGGRTWRKQEIRNARSLTKSAKLAAKHYPDGIIESDPQTYEDAYNMPDETRQQAKLRRAAMKKASKEKNIYGIVAAPYLSAMRTIELAEGYENLDSITADYENIVEQRNIKLEQERAENERLAEERRIDKERKTAEKKMKRRK